MDVTSPHNLAFAEDLYAQFLRDPQSVEPSWRSYFAGIEKGGANGLGTNGHAAHGHNGHTHGAALTPPAPARRAPVPDATLDDTAEVQDRVSRLVGAYRSRGHRFAHLDPLGLNPPPPDGLTLEEFGLSETDLDTVVSTSSFPGPEQMRLRDLIALLKDTYCRTVGVEFMHIDNVEMRTWLRDKMEQTRNQPPLSITEQTRILTRLTDAEVFEQFLHTKFVGSKRFSLEGGEALIPMLDFMVEHAGLLGARELVLGMAHRGRLNVLANIMRHDVESLFAKFDDAHPEMYLGSGDVKYHLGYSNDAITASGKKVHLSLCFNPSHLEFVNAVVEGRVRAKQDRSKDAIHATTIPVLIHGDAAFAGQGIVMETMQLAGLDGYRTGGTIHVVVNNQVGFTTSPKDSRSTPYCTDIGRMFHIPIFHVNGEDPEAVVHVTRLATEWRMTWKTDVIIDMYCFRKHGHNEGDEPTYTQPEMYRVVATKKPVRELYASALATRGSVTAQRAEGIRAEKRGALEAGLTTARKPDFEHEGINSMRGLWSRFKGGRDGDIPQVDTAITLQRAQTLLAKVGSYPSGFAAHPKLVPIMKGRQDMAEGKRPLDWGAAEALAFASLVTDGYLVRVSGQDSGRGTFAHRHSVLRSTTNGAEYVPLNHLSPEQAPYQVFDSPLSEAGVLGFEYGYSLDYPDALVIWEAQFGDFVNGAQVIIDQFMSSAEAKWNRLSGLCLFLPHGYEGQGPEHSSARMDRFLGLCAGDNMQVCNVTQPAQLFHLLRRQVLRAFRKPLVLFTPKSLLRHKSVVSDLPAFTTGGFQSILSDTTVDPANVRRVLLCSGKVYYDLEAARAEKNQTDVALVRMEQYYPFPLAQLQAEMARYRPGTQLVWVQEETWNAGAWHFIRGRIPTELQQRHPLLVLARRASPSPATGSLAAHKVEQAELVTEALGTGGSQQ